MLFTLIILYIITLIYISIVERFRNYSSLIAVQGWLLLGIALLRLHTLDWMELSFIITETLIFKALIVPGILMRVIKKTGINRISSTYYVADQTINMIFFGVALYALLTGLILIVLRSRIFTHMVGFLVIENGVFLFSMAIGVEMPLLINAAIMLDILLSVLMLGLFMTKVDKHIHTDDSDSLTHVKD